MYNRPLCFTLFSMLLAFASMDVSAQKRSKKRTPDAHHTVQPTQPIRAADLSTTPPGQVLVPQQSTLAPKVRKTKKVVIVPAPPPPPGRDPVPPYPKR